MLNLWELLVADYDPIREPPLSNSPQAALTHTKMCFETLTRLYYLRHGFETANIFFSHFLLVQSFASVAALNTQTSPSSTLSTDDVRATLFLAAKGLCDQGQNHYLAHTVYYAVESRMNPEDAELMWKFVHLRKEDSKARQLRAKHLQSQIPVDIVKITEHPEDKSLSNLIQQYKDMSLESSEEESSDIESNS